jgi:FixJ family two-component response regulator
VFLVDDDPVVRLALTRGLVAEGFEVRTWNSADSFLEEHDPEMPGCLIADIALPGMSGLELQSQLALQGCPRPIIFVTGRSSIRTTVQAMRAGAVSFLPKPVQLPELVSAIDEALQRDRIVREQRAMRAAVESRLTALTSREREVMELVVAGRLNKQIAAELGAAEKTIKVHRGRVMSKMRVRSVAELVRLTSRLGERPQPTVPPSS